MAEKKDTAKPAEGGAQPGSQGAGRKKINRLTKAEIEAKLNELRSSQGGLRSKHARQLLQRKKTLGA